MGNYFKGKTVWITGASAGIGEALAIAFATEGANLILSARNENLLQTVAAKCEQVGAGKVLVQPLDLTKTESLSAIATQVFQQMKQVDILINNGGVSQRGLVKDTAMEVYRQLMEVNFFGAVALTKLVLPNMIAHKSGQIVTITSLVGKIGTPLRSGYAASKHALHGFFDSLRAEVHDDNIKVLLVCPGFIHTNVSVNALSADGQTTGIMDKNQETGMPPEVLASKVLKAMQSNKQEIYIGGKEVLALYIKRFFPRLLSNIVRKQH
jgi:short-subunit dehydrogenase